MKKGKIFTFAVSILCLFSVLAGCKKGDNYLRIVFDIEDKDRYDAFFTKFEELNPDIKIMPLYGQDPSKLVGTKDEPDILKTGDAYIETVKNTLAPLDDFIKNDPTFDISIYYDNIIDSLKSDGKLYALPTSINTSLLYYNKTLFDESAAQLREAFGLGPDDSVYPEADWTWDDFEKAGVILTKYTGVGPTRQVVQWGAETQSTWWGEWLIYVRQMGGDFYSSTSNHISGLNTPEAIAGTRFMYEKSIGDDAHKFAPAITDNQLSFVSGKIAMIFGGHLGDWKSYDLMGLNWDVEVLPTPAGKPLARGGEISADAYGISARSTKKEKAYRFLKYWTSLDGAKEMYKYGKISALKSMKDIVNSVPESERPNPKNIDAVFKAIEIAMPLPKEKDFERICRQKVMNQIQIMLLGNETPEQAMVNADNAVNKYYKDLYGD